MRIVQRELRDAWLTGLYVGGVMPTAKVYIRRGYLKRGRDENGWWTGEWTPIEDYVELPGVTGVDLEADYGQNGMQTCTVDVANVYMKEVAAALGTYHVRERGWFSPYRAYVAPRRMPRIDRATGQRVQPNQWERILSDAAEVRVDQGYGPYTMRTFSGLIDTFSGRAKPSTLRLVARDFGQLLTDAHVFGWNIDPKLRDPITFVDRGYVQRRERSKDAFKRREAREHRKRSVIIDDLSDVVVYALRWAGFKREACRVQKVGVKLKQPIQFGRGEFLWDLIKKCQDVTGYTFWLQPPTAAFPMGRPTFRRSNAMYPPDAPAEDLRDDLLLQGFEWQHTDEPLAGIIRVRGKDDPEGMTLGGDKLKRVMAVYRPPWHVPRPNTRYSRDARLIRHVVHTEPLYTTKKQCEVAARMIALQEAMTAVTATPEIPGHPGLELDDVVGISDADTGTNSRALIARLQSSFRRSREGTTWKQTLGVTLLDTPDVVQVVDDLNEALRKPDEMEVDGGATFGAFGTFGASVGGRG